MTIARVVERLNDAVSPRNMSHSADGKRTVAVRVDDLAELLRDHHDMDARLRSAHVRDEPRAYPPRRDMLARVAADPGAYAGYKGDRTMGRWIADAILETERHVVKPLLLGVIERNWNAGPDALVDAILALPDPGVEDFNPAAIAGLKRTYTGRKL